MYHLASSRVTKRESRTPRLFALGVFLVSILFGCSGDQGSPTSVTPATAPSMGSLGSADRPTGSGSLTAHPSSSDSTPTRAPGDVSSSPAAAAGEEFNCTNLEERNVRFSDPGFVDQNRVGLYYKYVGVPTGRTLLELFWNEENEPSASQLVDLGDGDVERNDDSRTDYEGVVEHSYSGISEETLRVVRANLISYGRTGNCATVRRITVTPGAATSAGPTCSSTPTGTFAQGNSQLGRIFRDGTPSGCGGKAYPGIFNPGTPYYYETFNFQAQGSGAVCVRVNFDPNTGATPCATNAHASAYSGTYDPNNQSANYLGDVGSSVTQPFQFTIAGGSSFQVVVTNTASQANCSFSFTVDNANCR